MTEKYIKISNKVYKNGSSREKEVVSEILAETKNQIPDLWTICDISYREWSSQIRCKRFEGQIKVEIYFNDIWIPLVVEGEPNLSELIINFYNRNFNLN